MEALPVEFIGWLMGTGGLTGGLAVAVWWQHREIQRLQKWREDLLNKLIEREILTPIEAQSMH